MHSRDESSNVHALKHKLNNKRGGGMSCYLV